MVHNNALTIQFIGHYVMVCEDPANTTLWARVHRSTYLDIQGDLLPLADDLKHLPLPFLDPAVVQPLSLPVVFASTPSMKAIQAAGIVTSYFGMISESRPVRFPVHIGAIPAGQCHRDFRQRVQSARGPGHARSSTAPTVAMRTNPNDPFGKVLVIAGQDADQTIRAAQAVALHTDLLQGAQTTIETLNLPAQRAADDAPRWARTDQTVALWDYATADQLQGDGSAPLSVYFRLAPDLFYNERPNAILRLGYRYNSMPIGPISSMQVRVNNAFLGSVPLIPGQEASRRMQLDVPVPVVNLRPFSNSLSFDFTFQLLKKGKLPGHHADQHAGRDPEGFLPGSARISALCAHAQPGDLCQRGLPVHALCRPGADHGGAAAHAHRAGDRNVRHADGALRPPDGLSGRCGSRWRTRMR